MPQDINMRAHYYYLKERKRGFYQDQNKFTLSIAFDLLIIDI